MMKESGAHATPAVGVAVVNHNTREHLDRCLASVVAQRPARIVVVDNGSTDGSAALVRARYSGVELVANRVNRGYGAAANQAIRECGTPFVLLLNADTALRAGALARLSAFADTCPRAAVIGPRLITPDGSIEHSFFRLPGTLGWLLENEPASWLTARVPPLRARALAFADATVPRRVPWVLGAALLLRVPAVQEVGGFDEDFFMYYEEVDLCRRLGQSSWEVHYCPEAEIEHVGAASTSQAATDMRIQHFRSTLRYYRQHSAGARRAFWIGVMQLKMMFRLGRDTVRRQLSSAPAERAELDERIGAWRGALRNGGAR